MGVLIAAEKVGIGCAGWVYRAILDEVSQVLAERGHDELADGISDENASVQLYDCLDARTLTPANHEAFLSALPTAHERSEAKGAVGWWSPEYRKGYADLFASLVAQVEQAARGVPPTSWPNLVVFPEHNQTQRYGPGWPGQEAN